MPITIKQKGSGIVTINTSNASEGLLLNFAGGDIEGANTSGESVSVMSVSEVMFTGHWHILRGANVIFDTGNANSVGHFDFQASNMRLEADNAQLTSNVTASFQGGGDGTMILKMHKQSGQL
jgi:hypothetical protein